MKTKTTSGIMLTLLLTSVLTLIVNIQTVSAESTRLYIDPPVVYALPSESFTVDIKVADVVYLHTWQVNMTFNATVLQFVNVTEGDFLKKGGKETVGFSRLDKVDEGWAVFSWSIVGMYSESGSGTLATVEFKVLAEGESELKLQIEPRWIDRSVSGLYDNDGVVQVYKFDMPYLEAMGWGFDYWTTIRGATNITEVDKQEESELTYPTALIRFFPPPIPPGGTEQELIPFKAVDGYFTSRLASTMVYFNLSPNPVGFGETLTLKGILVDEFSQPLSNETVKLYARPLAGSWQYITSVATNSYGIFTWQATIPRTVTQGTYIFAVYYPSSEIYESTYNLAVLIIQ